MAVTVSTHVLDTERGRPAAGIHVELLADDGALVGEGVTDGDPAVLDELDRLNRAYEKKFGFRFVVFVNRRPRREIVPVLRERLQRTREQELETAVDELVQIAIDRWRSS